MRPHINNRKEFDGKWCIELSAAICNRDDRPLWKRGYAHASKGSKVRRVRPAHRDYFVA